MTISLNPGTVRRPARRAGPPQGSSPAKRLAAAILEVLAGLRSPADAAVALGTSVPRYYLLEQRALQGLLAACEPRPKGRLPDETRRSAELERNVSRLQRECLRQQALVRAAQRAVGLSPPQAPKPTPAGKRRRSRKPVVRALKAAAALRADSSSPKTPEEVQPTADHG